MSVVGGQSPSSIVSLSAKGIANVCHRDSNFTFIVGSREYLCPSFIAEFLSPRVCQIHSSDETMNELRLDIEDTKDVFSQFLSLGDGRTIGINRKNRFTMLAICEELWNSEVYDSVYRGTLTDITREKVIDRMRILSKKGCDISREVEFMASNFYDTDASEIESFSFAMIS
jgi:hypothetical protein